MDETKIITLKCSIERRQNDHTASREHPPSWAGNRAEFNFISIDLCSLTTLTLLCVCISPFSGVVPSDLVPHLGGGSFLICPDATPIQAKMLKLSRSELSSLMGPGHIWRGYYLAHERPRHAIWQYLVVQDFVPETRGCLNRPGFVVGGVEKKRRSSRAGGRQGPKTRW